MGNAVVLKLHDGQEANEAGIAGLQRDTHALHAKCKSQQEEQNVFARGASELRGDITKIFAAQDQSRKATDKVSDGVRALREAQSQSKEHIEILRKQLDVVHLIAAATQEGLQVTNSLALPNLKAVDSPRLSPTYANGMSPQVPSPVDRVAPGMASKKGTPRLTRKEKTW